MIKGMFPNKGSFKDENTMYNDLQKYVNLRNNNS